MLMSHRFKFPINNAQIGLFDGICSLFEAVRARLEGDESHRILHEDVMSYLRLCVRAREAAKAGVQAAIEGSFQVGLREYQACIPLIQSVSEGTCHELVECGALLRAEDAVPGLCGIGEVNIAR